jgi:glutamyl-tRNA synthetase
MAMIATVRFAPSPTGLIHIGNARAALINWLYARREGGTFLLRLDDTDDERSTPEYAAAIERDLAWLGLNWDRYARQSDRLPDYDRAAEKLKQAGRLYPCYETAEELNLKRKSLLGRSMPPIYDRAALRLGEAERLRLEAEGRRPHWRFKIEHKPVEWDDLIHGRLHFEGRTISDPVLIREDGRPLYSLASVIDDIEFGISLVVRGEDHIANTAYHVQMFEAFGAAPPQFAHYPLLMDAEGEKLSKRIGSLSIQGLRADEGIEPMAVVSLLAKLGTSDPIEPRLSLEELVPGFDFSKFSRSAARFDFEELLRLNAKILHETSFEAVRDRLAALGIEADEAFWNAVRPNLVRLRDIAEWRRVAQGPIQPVIEDASFAHEAAAALPQEPWSEATWGEWTEAVKRATGRKGRALFMPLRQALTGLDHGPELKTLLPLIGRDRALARLQGRAA